MGIKMKKLVIIGASGHGKVAADIAVQNGYENRLLLDDNLTEKECGSFQSMEQTGIL